MRLERTARLHQSGVTPTHDFNPGQPVMTRDGFPGVVTAVSDGPIGGAEVYDVVLDQGMGGGKYDARELSPIATVTAVTEHEAVEHEAIEFDASEHRLASDDYPMLTEVLVRRPPLERTASIESALWARRIAGGPWHLIPNEGSWQTACNKSLTGELDRERYAGVPTGFGAGTVCPVCASQRTATWNENGEWENETITTSRCAHCNCTENTHQLLGERCVKHHDCPGWTPGPETSWTPQGPRELLVAANYVIERDDGEVVAGPFVDLNAAYATLQNGVYDPSEYRVVDEKETDFAKAASKVAFPGKSQSKTFTPTDEAAIKKWISKLPKYIRDDVERVDGVKDGVPTTIVSVQWPSKYLDFNDYVRDPVWDALIPVDAWNVGKYKKATEIKVGDVISNSYGSDGKTIADGYKILKVTDSKLITGPDETKQFLPKKKRSMSGQYNDAGYFVFTPHPSVDPKGYERETGLRVTSAANDSIVGDTNVQYVIKDQEGNTHGEYGTMGTAQRHKYEKQHDPNAPEMHVEPKQEQMHLTAGWIVVDQGGSIWGGPYENKYRAEDEKNELFEDAQGSGLTLMVQRSDDGTGLGGEGWGGGGIEGPDTAPSIYSYAKDQRFEGVGLKEDDDGWYVRTHRARSKSYPTPEDIPQKDVDFIESTGSVEVPVHLGGILDTINDKLTDKVYDMLGAEPGADPSYDWCAYRHQSHCFWPKDLNVSATKQAGYPVWIPFDRGPCPRVKWESQKACPMADPGPFSGDPDARLESWKAWEDGGQRGGYAGSLRMTANTGHPEIDKLINDFLNQTIDGLRIRDLADPSTAHGTCQEVSEWFVEFAKKRGFKAYATNTDLEELGYKTTGAPHGEVLDDDGNIVQGFYPEHTIVTIPIPDGSPYGHDVYVDFTASQYGYKEFPKYIASKDDEPKPITVESSFEFTSSWRDIQTKASRIRKEGGVRIIAVTGGYVTAEVKGDNAVYQTTILRSPGSNSIAMWECGCPWANYSWGRSGRWKKYEGRMCAHALALVYQAQSEEWGNGELAEKAESAWPGEKVHVPDAYKKRPPAWRVGSRHEAMRSVSLDPSLNLSPRMAIMGFDVQIGNSVRKVVDIVGSMLRLMDGSEVPADNVEHPGFDLRKGLNFHESAKTGMAGVNPDDTPESVAKVIFQHAQTLGPKVTRDMQAVAGLVGGKMAGLDFKYKSEDSLARKLRDKYWDKARGNASAAADMVGDALRFTIILADVEYTHDVQQAIYAFQEMGYKILDEENSWRSGDAYSALHYGLDYRGTPIELQFHTSDSYQVKQFKSHKLLEEFRLPSTPLKRKQELWDLMTANYDKVNIPDDVLNYPFEKIYPRPASLQQNASFEVEASRHFLSQAEVSNGAMVALVPPLAVRQALIEDAGEPLEQMHITLVYLGKVADIDGDAVHRAVAEWAAGTPELPSEFSGYGVFVNGEEPVLWAGFDTPELTRYREGLMDSLGRCGVVPPNNHGFSPHMTLAYGRGDIPEDVPEISKFAFDSVAIAEGGVWTYYPLAGNPVEPVVGEVPPPIEVYGDDLVMTSKLAEDYSLYFKDLEGTEEIPMGSLKFRIGHFPEDQPGSVDRAEEFMELSAKGEKDKRKPIDVKKDGDKYLVVDGNATTGAAMRNGWEAIPAKVSGLDALIAERIASDPASGIAPMAAAVPDEGVSEMAFEASVGGTHGPGGDPVASHLAGVPSEGSRSWLMDSAPSSGSSDIAAAAQEFLKTGAAKFSPQEQRQIIEEGRADGTRAANLDRLDLTGTHYRPPSEADAVTDDEFLWT